MSDVHKIWQGLCNTHCTCTQVSVRVGRSFNTICWSELQASATYVNPSTDICRVEKNFSNIYVMQLIWSILNLIIILASSHILYVSTLTWEQPERSRWLSLWQPFPVVRYCRPLSEKPMQYARFRDRSVRQHLLNNSQYQNRKNTVISVIMVVYWETCKKFVPWEDSYSGISYMS